MNRRSGWLAVVIALPPGAPVLADGIVVDKVYHPYVDALEKELEYRALLPGKQPGLYTPEQLHQVSLGRAIGSKVFAEVYMVGEKGRAGGFNLTAWEIETKWQLTEQGEYAADFGLLFEYEVERHKDAQEFNVALLVEKEWGDWSSVANLHLINEWGDDSGSEFETALGLQTRYRLSRLFEPGIEVYAGQNTRAAGPVLQGSIDAGVGRNFHWEAGALFGLDDESAATSWRFLLEYEF